MRKDATSQIETCEISDSELDTISGGVAGAAVNVGGYSASVGVGDLVGAAQSQLGALPLAQMTGLVTVQATPGL